MLNELCIHCKTCELNVDNVCHSDEECTCMDCLVLKRIISDEWNQCEKKAKVSCWVNEEEYYCGD
jgi:hypothetical protein